LPIARSHDDYLIGDRDNLLCVFKRRGAAVEHAKATERRVFIGA
jgi:hypothetical protein